MRQEAKIEDSAGEIEEYKIIKSIPGIGSESRQRSYPKAEILTRLITQRNLPRSNLGRRQKKMSKNLPVTK
ncbi:MAG: hypothetical protein ACQEWV_00130 [Bacillota bacterium]